MRIFIIQVHDPVIHLEVDELLNAVQRQFFIICVGSDGALPIQYLPEFSQVNKRSPSDAACLLWGLQAPPVSTPTP